MLLLRGATSAGSGRFWTSPCFNTCSSCEEQLRLDFGGILMVVSIHAPLARSNAEMRRGRLADYYVSIHAPLARSNMRGVTCPLSDVSFQYMLLLRGATDLRKTPASSHTVSIHAPLARSNLPAILTDIARKFQYMLLLRGATPR